MNYYNENDRYAAAWLRELIADGQIPKGEVDERSITDVQPTDLSGFTQCHFFAGVGGWSYALRLAGWGDDSPIWTGSCPCQPFSSAGKGKGTADERHLWPQFFRLIGQCRPDVVFGEQVASKAGLAWLDGICDDLEGAFYSVWACDTCAAGVGAPHIRQRLWWVAESRQQSARRRLQRSKEGARPDQGGASGEPERSSGVSSRLADTRCVTGRAANAGQEARTDSGFEASGTAGRLAHSDQPSDNGWSRSGEQSVCDQDDEISGVVQPDSPRPQQGSVSASALGHRDSPNSTGGDGDGLGDTNEPRSQRRSLDTGEHPDQCPAWETSGTNGLGLTESQQARIPGLAWRQSESIPCSDGKSRRIESGTLPLVARLSETVVPSGDPSLSYVQATAEGLAMRLRGYGNAIVPPLAAEFIMAYMNPASGLREGEDE